MDSVVSTKLIEDIKRRLDDIESIKSESEYESAMDIMFDDEDSLREAVNILVEETLTITQSIQGGPKGPQPIPESHHRVIMRAVKKAAALAFLCERFSRDHLMDANTKHDNSKFRRDYESFDDFVKRKVASYDTAAIIKEASAEGK